MNETKPKYKRPRTEAQRAGEARYKAKNEMNVMLHLNRKTDADIIQFLEWAKRNEYSVPSFIKSCIRDSMHRICID